MLYLAPPRPVSEGVRKLPIGLKFQPTQGMPARPTLSSMRHQWPIFSSMSWTGEGDLLPGGHEDVVQLQAVGLDLLPRPGQRVGAVLAGPDLLRQRGVGRSGAGPAAGGGGSPAQVQVDGVDADGAEEAKVPRVELVDGDLVLDVHQATGRSRWFWPP